jgi:hypothetical protein
MWLWVQAIAIPHQASESVARGIPRGNLSDLYPRWLGARELLLRGRDPYSREITREIQQGYYGREIDPSRPNDPRDQQAFAYPLYVVFVLAPTVGLPFRTVQHGFFWLLVMITGASVPLWLGALKWRVSTTANLVAIVLALGCFPAIQGFKLQQLTLLVAALIAGSLYAIVGRHFILAGVLLAVASIKPQLVALLVLWLFIWVSGNWRERRRLLWSFAAAMFVLIAGAELLLPGWIAKFRAASAAYYQYTGGGTSVLDVALTPLWGRIVAAILVCLLIGFTWYRRRAGEGTLEFQWSLALTLATTLAVIPMFAPYNQVLLIPALMVALRAIRPLWKHPLSRFFTVLVAVSVMWPWIASTALAMALLFLPAPVVQRAWTMPLFTSLAIPVVVLGLLIASRNLLQSPSANPAPSSTSS